MAYSFEEHTADVRMNVGSESFPDLFRQSLLGMFDLMRPATLAAKAERVVDIRSADATALLVDFLNEALSLAQVHREAYASVRFLTLGPTELRAKLSGRRVFSFGEDIKAATYHEAKVEQDASGMWHAHVIFDI